MDFLLLQKHIKITHKNHVLEAREGKDLGPKLIFGVVLEAMKGQIRGEGGGGLFSGFYF